MKTNWSLLNLLVVNRGRKTTRATTTLKFKHCMGLKLPLKLEPKSTYEYIVHCMRIIYLHFIHFLKLTRRLKVKNMFVLRCFLQSENCIYFCFTIMVTLQNETLSEEIIQHFLRNEFALLTRNLTCFVNSCASGSNEVCTMSRVWIPKHTLKYPS